MILIIGADYVSLLNLGATYTAKSFSESKYMKHMEKLSFPFYKGHQHPRWMNIIFRFLKRTEYLLGCWKFRLAL